MKGQVVNTCPLTYISDTRHKMQYKIKITEDNSREIARKLAPLIIQLHYTDNEGKQTELPDGAKVFLFEHFAELVTTGAIVKKE